jgi:hypothetical protein
MTQNNTRYFILLLLISTTSICSAQFRGAIMTLGFQTGGTKISPAFYTRAESAGVATLTKQSDDKLTVSNLNLAMEAYGKVAYFDMGIGYGFKGHLKDHPEYRGKDRTGFETRLAFGGYIKQKVGIMAGGQYAYSYLNVDYVNGTVYPAYLNRNLTPVGKSFIDKAGGGQFGWGIHVMFTPTDKLLFRASYMSNWIIRERSTVKGRSVNPEFAAYYCFNDAKTFGVFAKLAMATRTMEQFNEQSSGSSSTKPTMLIPEFKTSSTTFSIGIMLPPGIFGGAEAQSGRITVE